MTKHRVPVLSSRLRRYEDPERSRDPRVQSVVTALKSLPPDAIAPAPRAHFRAELRTQLIAVAPRIIAERAAEAAPEVSTTAREPRTESHRERSGFFGRPFRVAGAVLAACLVLFGGAVWESQRALPGDALYSLKRATEDVRLAFAGSDTARARDYLGFAGTRVEEAQALVRRALPSASGPVADGRISSSTAALLRSTLGSADSDVRSASRLLTAAATAAKSPAPLTAMRQWAPGQLHRLRQLHALLPPGSLRHRASESAAVVRHADLRATALTSVIHRGCLAHSHTDSLGTKPCSGSGNGPHRHQPGSGNHSGPGSHHPGPRHGSGGPHSGSTAPGTRPRGGHSGSSLPSAPTGPSLPSLPTLPSLPIPTSSLPLPLPTSSLPISLGSCDSLPLGITLGNCPPS